MLSYNEPLQKTDAMDSYTWQGEIILSFLGSSWGLVYSPACGNKHLQG